MLNSADRIGRWTVDSPLELTGLGSAYSARTTEPRERSGTLLVIHTDDFEATRAQVEQQIDQLGRPSTEHVFPIMDWGTDESRSLCWVVLPPLEGATLADWLHEGKRPPPQIRGMVDDVIGAIEALKENRVKLGWLSPAQFVADTHGRFRLVPVPTPFLTTSSGTAHLRNLRYLAPEYFDEERASAGVQDGDHYSLAIFVFEALLGRPAFLVPPDHEDAFGTLRQMKSLDGGLDPGEDFPIAIRRTLWQATHRDGDKRPADPRLLAEALGPGPVKVAATRPPQPEPEPEPEPSPEASVDATDVPAAAAIGAGAVAAPETPEVQAEEAWGWHEEETVELDEQEDDVELESYRPIRDSLWLRVLFAAALIVGLLAIWFLWLRPEERPGAPADPPSRVASRADPTAARSAEQLGGRSDAYVFPESWRERTSATTWTQANFPKAWLESIAPHSWKKRAMDEQSEAELPSPPEPTPPPGFGQRDLFLGNEIRHEGPVALRGIWAESKAQLGIPDTWEIWGDPTLELRVKHSPELIPEVSTLGVWTDGQPSGSFYLRELKGQAGAFSFPVQLLDADGYHSIQFSGYHRSQLPCESDIGDDLWSTVTQDTHLSVHYRERPPEANLARWPYPFVDHRHPDPFQLSIVLPDGSSEPAIHAAGLLAAALRSAASWHPIEISTHVGGLDTAPAGHLIVLSHRDSAAGGTLLGWLQGSHDPELAIAARDQAAGKPGGAAGLLALRPRSPGSRFVVLTLLGEDGPGLVSLARLLASERAAELLQGSAERIESITPRSPMPPREWRGAIPPRTRFTLLEMGYGDLMATGFRGGKVTLPIHHVPDEKFSPGRARLSLVYSYSAQVDPGSSRLWVYLDKDPLTEVALEDLDGRHDQRLEVDIPVQRIGPDSVVEVVFDLRGYEDDTCLGAAHSFLWGTVHADTSFNLPRENWSRINDLGLLRFGAYPFGIRADLSETTFVLPPSPSARLVEAYVQLAGELGRLARGDRIDFGLRLGARPSSGQDLDVIVMDEGPDNSLLEELDLAQIATDGLYELSAIAPAFAQGDASVGAGMFMEIRPAPWNGSRSVLITRLDGDGPAALFQCGKALGPAGYLHGRSVRMDDCGPPEVLSGRREAYTGTLPIKAGVHRWIRRYYWSLVAIAVCLVAILLLLRYRHRSRERERDAADGKDHSHFYNPEG